MRMLSAQEIKKVVDKGLCCLARKSAEYIRARWRNQQCDDFLDLAMALEALMKYVPEGETLHSVTIYTPSIVNNPGYTQNEKVLCGIKMDKVKFEENYNVNNDITRLFSAGTMYVFINGVLIGAESIIATDTVDYANSAAGLISGSGHDYEAVVIEDNINITVPTNNNVLRTGNNNSGKFKKDYDVVIYFQGTYPPEMCDYSTELVFPESEWEGMVIRGLTINGVYHSFQMDVPYQNNYPYGHPLYNIGIQKQIQDMVGPGNIIINITGQPDPPNEDVIIFTITIKACPAPLDSIRFYNTFYPNMDYPFASDGCGTSPFTIYFYNGQNNAPKMGNFIEGNYLLGTPQQRCTYGISITSDNITDSINAVVINGVKYYPGSELTLNNPSGILSWLNGIALQNSLQCEFEVTYDDSISPAVFTILKTNYSYDVMDAASFHIDGIERVRAFEKLSCIAMNPSQVTQLQTPQTQCMSDKTALELVSIITKECCECGN